MMSKQQYLNDRAMSWHPHLSFLSRVTRQRAGEPTCQVRRFWPRMTLKSAKGADARQQTAKELP